MPRARWAPRPCRPPHVAPPPRRLLASKRLTEEELGLVANLSPSSAEEVRKLMPSLDDRERFSDEDLDQMLREIASYREFE